MGWDPPRKKKKKKEGEKNLVQKFHPRITFLDYIFRRLKLS